MKRICFILCLFTLVVIHSNVHAQVKAKAAIVAFYNLENLFDTIDDPKTNDAEFLPSGINGWTSARYNSKIKNMSEVISRIGEDYVKGGPTLIGVSEIENEGVLRDLISTPALAPSNYGIVHFDSPDRRGVDVGLLYRKNDFKVLNATSTRLIMPGDTNFLTRDQLCVTGILDGDTLSIIVNHWPSRGNAEPTRLAAGALSRHLVDSLYKINPNAKVFVEGDLNDDPVDPSVTKYLGAVGKLDKVEKGGLFDPMWQLFKDGIGSLAYKDSWNLFDQIIVSEPLLRKGPGWYFFKARIFYKPFLIATEGQYAGYPMRTFSNGAFVNGYSDHLPSYLVIVKEK